MIACVCVVGADVVVDDVIGVVRFDIVAVAVDYNAVSVFM